MAATKRHKEVGTVANHPVFHFVRQLIGATGAVGTTYQGGGASIASVTRVSAGLYRFKFAEPSPFYIVGIYPFVHGVGPVVDPVLKISYVPGTIARSSTVLQFDLQVTGPTADNNATPVATDPPSGSELHVQIAEIYNDALRPRPDAGV